MNSDSNYDNTSNDYAIDCCMSQPPPTYRLNSRLRKYNHSNSLAIKKKLKLLQICNNISIDGFHNKSSVMLTTEQSLVLSLGMKFIPKPPNSHPTSILTDFDRFARNIRLKYQFILQCNEKSPEELQSFLRRTSSNYYPSKAHFQIEQYLSDSKKQLIESLTATMNPYNTFYYERDSIFQPIIDSLNDIDSIIITLADKNMGPTIVDRSWYETTALKHLLDYKTYLKLDKTPPVGVTLDQLKSILIKYSKYFVSDTSLTPLAQSLLNNFSKYQNEDETPCSYFYLLIKLHKPPPTPISGRPIVASIRSLTYSTSKYLDIMLKPVMKRFKSYLKDSFELVHHLETTTYPTDAIIVTGDINSLYPSIDITDGLRKIRLALQLYSSYEVTDIDFLMDLLEWVLRHNYIEFGDTKWLQIKGTAMGTPVAVTFANIYLGMLELELSAKGGTLLRQNTLYHKRYIDDIFCLFSNTSNATAFCNIFNGLRPNNITADFIVSDTTGTILDITIAKKNRFHATSKLDITLFQKECNKYLYLPFTSYHPKPVFKGFITSELKRFRINCSDDLDFYHNKNAFLQRLSRRGYPDTFLQSVFTIHLDRSSLLLQRITARNNNHQQTINSTPVVLVTEFTPIQATMDLHNKIRPNDRHLSDPISNFFFSTYKPIVAYKSSHSLRYYFIRAKYSHKITLPPEDNSSH